MNAQLKGHTDRRQALKFGGLTFTLAAFAAACGENRSGDDAPGRIGTATVPTTPPDYQIDDAVLFRTASSLEYTAIAVYQAALDLEGAISDDLAPVVNRLIEDHQQVADRMTELTESVDGTPWTSPNPWLMERLVEPTLEKIQADVVGVVAADEDGSIRVQVIGELLDIAETVSTVRGELTATSSIDNPTEGDEITFTRLEGAVPEDVLTFAQALESLAAASHQQLASAAATTEARVAHLDAALLEARHSAVLAIASQGASGYVSPTLYGQDVAPTDRGQIRHFAVDSIFGETAQIEFKAGPADLNAVRESVVLQTPAANSMVYNELEPDS